MSQTRKRDRIIALVVALFFLGLASSLSVLVIYQVVTAKNNSKSSDNTGQSTATTLAGTQLSGFTPVSSVSALQSTDMTVGSGQAAKAGDTVTVQYTGAVASTGIIFQSTQDSGQSVPVTLNTGPEGVIAGWAKGVPGMKVGGTRRLLIPASEAYGANPPEGSGIPANAALVFDIKLIKIGS